MATGPATPIPVESGEREAEPGQPKAQELKLVIALRGDKAIIGVQRPDTDPWVRVVDDGDLERALEQVPRVYAEATLHWQEQARFPEYQRPAPPPRPATPPETRARTAPRGTARVAPPAEPAVESPRMF